MSATDFITLGPSIPSVAELTAPPRPSDTLNVVLHPSDDPQWEQLMAPGSPLYGTRCWHRKIAGARFQYAHLFKCCWFHDPTNGAKDKRILIPGDYEDPLPEALARAGAFVVGVDPLTTRTTLREALAAGHIPAGSFDLVLAASVLEHTEDDAYFLSDVLLALKPGGLAYLTCDFREGWEPGGELAPTQRRLYTKRSLTWLTDTLDGGVTPFEVEDADRGPRHGGGRRDWSDRGNYFEYGGMRYAFASVAFQKALREGE